MDLPNLPRYHMRKEVAAFKITAAEYQPDGSLKLSGDDGKGTAYTVNVEDDWVQRSLPSSSTGVPSFVGGYYVVYPPANLASWFHAGAFEQEYVPE